MQTQDTPEISRKFKGVWIPKQIWLNPDINWIEKCLLAEIMSLSDENGCRASNHYLGLLFGKGEGTIANIITKLRKRGLLKTTQFDGRNRSLVCVFDLDEPSQIGEPCHNRSVNELSPIRESSSSLYIDRDTSESTSANARSIIDFLNQATGKHYRHVPANLRLIISRLNEPEVTVDGVKQMIDRQVKCWRGTEMEQYLRPETLFRASKFESYYANRDTSPKRNNEPVENAI